MSFRHSVFLGETSLSEMEIQDVIEDLKHEFPGNSYDLFKNNCNHFSNALSLALVGREIPSFIFNPSKGFAFVRCLVPKRFL